MAGSQKKKIWLVEDNVSYRESVRLVLQQADDFSCEREFTSAEGVIVALQQESAPHIILCDIGLPKMNGIEAVQYIKSKYPAIQIIMLTALDEDEKVFSAICAGASGYLLKSATEREICSAIRQVLEGGSPMNAQIARKVLERFTQLNPTASQYELTDREKEILKFIVDGTTKKAMALELGISFHTVDSHMRNIYEKLQVHSRSEAVSKAMKERLI